MNFFKSQWLLFLMLVGFFACKSAPDAATETTMPAVEDSVLSTLPADTVGAESTASTALDFAGTYKGTLPCADCEGIETTLVIKADKTYELRTFYAGKKDAKTFSSKGAWSWTTGNIIKLEAEKDGPNQYFIAEGKVFKLDVSGNKITGDLADKYILTKLQ